MESNHASADAETDGTKNSSQSMAHMSAMPQNLPSCSSPKGLSRNSGTEPDAQPSQSLEDTEKSHENRNLIDEHRRLLWGPNANEIESVSSKIDSSKIRARRVFGRRTARLAGKLASEVPIKF